MIRRGAGWRRLDRELRRRFADEPGPDGPGPRPGTGLSPAVVRDRHETLAGYFTLGFLRRRLEPASLARLPGAPSTNGRRCDLMEGFTRIAPLLAAWVAGGRGDRMPLPDGGSARPLAILSEGIAAGTDPSGPGFWGPIRDRRQQIVEAADVALAVWLARDELWDGLRPAVRDRLVEWLSAGVDRDLMDNNWHLFPVTIDAALRALDVSSGAGSASRPASCVHYDRFKEFHLGEGWFRDGPGGRVDYYNAWQMHYALYWIRRMQPSLDRSFLEEAAEQFVAAYRMLIGPEGFPVLGRSVCYRMAAPAPLVAAALSGSDSVPPGMARRALDRTWAHFIARGAVARGCPTQGYGRTDLRFLDAYSGPASPLWSLRSLVLALSAPPDSPVWTAPEEPLPIERESFELRVSPVGWTVRGDRATREITIHRDEGREPDAVEVRAHPRWRRALDRWRGEPSRPGNDAAKFDLARYSSREPFCGYGPRTRRNRSREGERHEGGAS